MGLFCVRILYQTLAKNPVFLHDLRIGCYTVVMNEKITKKIGEAYAFAQVLETTFTNNQAVLTELLGASASTVLATTAEQKAALHAMCDAAGTTEILLPKVEKTAAKITNMGEMYVGDDWDDAAEVLEWLSFFVGGAVIHWQLIAGAGAAMDDEMLTDAATSGVVYYEALLAQLKTAATQIGVERVG